MFKKIITYLFLASIILPTTMTAPLDFGVSRVYAQETETSDVVNNGKSSNNKEVGSPCDWNAKATWGECISYTFLVFLYDFILQAGTFITYIAGNLFNASIDFSLTGHIFDTNANVMLASGWAMTRNLVNMVFIFVLLYVAISTILQYGNFGKAVIINIIVAAVLINFSLLITKMVIDSSHVFAWEFYNQIDVQNMEKTAGNKEQYANLKSDIEIDDKLVKGFQKKNFANVFMAAFDPQKTLTGDSKDPPSFIALKDEAIRTGKSFGNIAWKMGIIILLHTALALLAAFILFAGAIMFVARVVILWFVIIFAPVGFLGMAVPNMKKYSSQWWSYLIGQSFFAPAFLFMFMLVTKLVNAQFVQSVFHVTENNDLMVAWKINGGDVLLPVFYYIVAGGLMWGALYIAHQVGGKTASLSIGWAHTARGWAQGAVAGAGRYGWQGAKGGTRRWYAPVAEKYSTGEGRIGRVGDFMRKIPFLGSITTRKAADVSNKSKAIIDEKQKKYAGYSPKQMAKITEAGGKFDQVFRPYETAARAKVMEGKKALKDTDPEIILQAIKTLEGIGDIKGVRSLKKLRPDLASGEIITPAISPAAPAPLPVAAVSAIKEAVGYQKPEDIIEVKFETSFFNKNPAGAYLNPAAEAVTNGMVEKYTAGHIRKLFERGDVLYDEFVGKIEKLIAHLGAAGRVPATGKARANLVAAEVRALGNKGLARAIEAGNLNDLLDLDTI